MMEEIPSLAEVGEGRNLDLPDFAVIDGYIRSREHRKWSQDESFELYAG